MDKVVTDQTFTDFDNYKSTILLSTYTASRNKNNLYYQRRPTWVLSSAPSFTMTDRFNNRASSDALVSLPSYQRMVDPTSSINETEFERVMIKMKDGMGSEEIK